MHPPILRWASTAALALCLVSPPAWAGALAAPQTADDPTRIRLDRGLHRAISASAFDAGRLVAAQGAWFDEIRRAPVAEPVAPLRELVLDDSDEIVRRHSVSVRTVGGLARGAAFVDAWLLVAVPFLVPVILRRRPRRRSRSWTAQLPDPDDAEADVALDAIVRSPYEATSLS